MCKLKLDYQTQKHTFKKKNINSNVTTNTITIPSRLHTHIWSTGQKFSSKYEKFYLNIFNVLLSSMALLKNPESFPLADHLQYMSVSLLQLQCLPRAVRRNAPLPRGPPSLLSLTTDPTVTTITRETRCSRALSVIKCTHEQGISRFTNLTVLDRLLVYIYIHIPVFNQTTLKRGIRNQEKFMHILLCLIHKCIIV